MSAVCDNCLSAVGTANILCPVCDAGMTRDRPCGVNHTWASGKKTECVLPMYHEGPHQGAGATTGIDSLWETTVDNRPTTGRISDDPERFFVRWLRSVANEIEQGDWLAFAASQEFDENGKFHFTMTLGVDPYHGATPDERAAYERYDRGAAHS